jgi:hypothetical protein
MSDRKMTRRSFIVSEHEGHERKLRAPIMKVTNPAQIADDALRVRSLLRSRA